jgi:hypothetical protein
MNEEMEAITTAMKLKHPRHSDILRIRDYFDERRRIEVPGWELEYHSAMEAWKGSK